MIAIVKSRDGVEFTVECADQRTAGFDLAFAAARPASELARHGDFTRLPPLRDVLADEEFVFDGPRIAGPLERRAAFRVIKGGKP
jgi:hypothetical protein